MMICNFCRRPITAKDWETVKTTTERLAAWEAPLVKKYHAHCYQNVKTATKMEEFF